jgi:hypothetical protein
MMIRHTKLVVTGTVVVLLTACSAQSGEPKNPASAAAAPAAHPSTPPPAASPAPAAAAADPTPAEASPVGGPAAPPADAAAGGPSAEATSTPAPAELSPAAKPSYREITLPAGTALPIDLRTTVASDRSHVEDRVRAALREPVSVRGVEVLPAGTVLTGHVTEAVRSARVKGRARVGFRFTSLDLPGDVGRTAIRTSAIVREAAATKKQDAAKIGGGAAGGAVIGAILGGGSGAAKGAAVGGAGGTGVVLATRGKEVSVPAGTNLIVRLRTPITVRVRR